MSDTKSINREDRLMMIGFCANYYNTHILPDLFRIIPDWCKVGDTDAKMYKQFIVDAFELTNMLIIGVNEDYIIPYCSKENNISVYASDHKTSAGVVVTGAIYRESRLIPSNTV